MKIGLAGLGNMGEGMALNLLDKGADIVVFNRTSSRADPFLVRGAQEAANPAQLTRAVDVVLVCVADARASKEVFLGRDGVVGAARAGQVLIDLSTVDPATSRLIHRAAVTKEARFLDAPVSGGPEGARAGSLTIMVGGCAADFEAARPSLRLVGANVVHMGPTGAGTITKLANQILVGIHTQAACEALLLGIEHGVDSLKLTRVLMSSWGASRMLGRNSTLISNRDFSHSGAPLKNLFKDLSISVHLAEEKGLELALARRAWETYRKAMLKGLAEQDLASVFDLISLPSQLET